MTYSQYRGLASLAASLCRAGTVPRVAQYGIHSLLFACGRLNFVAGRWLLLLWRLPAIFADSRHCKYAVRVTLHLRNLALFGI